MARTTNNIDLDDIVKMFDLPDWDDVESNNEQYIFESTRDVRSEMEQDEDVTEEQIEEAEMKAQQEASDEVYRQWHGAVESAAESLFEEHGLTLVPRRKNEKTPFEYRIEPEKSWDDAADKILDTINGIGEFEFASLREFLDSGPYTPRQAVLSHLGYVSRRPDVYGTASADRRYERAFR